MAKKYVYFGLNVWDDPFCTDSIQSIEVEEINVAPEYNQ